MKDKKKLRNKQRRKSDGGNIDIFNGTRGNTGLTRVKETEERKGNTRRKGNRKKRDKDDGKNKN